LPVYSARIFSVALLSLVTGTKLSQNQALIWKLATSLVVLPISFDKKGFVP